MEPWISRSSATKQAALSLACSAAGLALLVGFCELGRSGANGVTFYYLVLHLRAGGEFPLFGPGRFFPGGSNWSTVDAWRQRLEGFLAR